MSNQTTQPKALRNPEVVLNLWAYASEEGSIMRLAAKSYVMEGSDDDKLALLRQLAATDFLSAPWTSVPKNFKLAGSSGSNLDGVAHASMLQDEYTTGVLFGPLMNQLGKDLPQQARSENGEYVEFRLELGDSPLTVTTIVVEYEDGRLAPIVLNEHHAALVLSRSLSLSRAPR